MMPTKLLFLSPAVLLAACISLPDIETPQSPPDGSPDSGTPPSVTLTLLAPSANLYTNGSVSVQLQVQGDTPEQVELLVDDQVLTTLAAPYTFSWDTTSLVEGTHHLTARARIADKTFSSEVRDVVVDRTPPQVVSRAPTPGAQDVWVRQPIQATFSEPLKADTLTGTSVKLTVGGTEVFSSTSLSSDGKTLTLAPITRPEVPATAAVALSGAVTDLAGNPLALPADSWTWSLPLSFPVGNLSAVPGDTDASLPSLQMDRSGSLFVSWSEATGPTYWDNSIYVFELVGSDWQPIGTPIAPANLGTFSAPNPSYTFRIDSANNPVIAWSQREGLNSNDPVNTYIKHWSGNEWLDVSTSPNASLSHQTEDTAFTFQLDSNDRPIIAWSVRDSVNSLDSPLSIWRWTGSSWMDFGTPVSSIPPLFGEPIKLLLDGAKKPVLAWTDGDIHVSRWTGGEWLTVGSALGIFPGDTQTAFGDMVLDSAGNPIVAWAESDGSTVGVHVAHFAGSDWEILGEGLSAVPGATSAFSPRLQLDPEGHILVAWEEYSQPGQGAPLQVNLRRWTGSAWATIGASFILSQENIDPLNISFLMDPSGNAFLAWPEKTSTSAKSIRIHRYNY